MNKDNDIIVSDGSFSHNEIKRLTGFTDYKKTLLSKENMSDGIEYTLRGELNGK